MEIIPCYGDGNVYLTRYNQKHIEKFIFLPQVIQKINKKQYFSET
jgi:hypothetical protein